MRRQIVHSSLLRSVGYDSGKLEVEFASGAVWIYEGVPEQLYEELLAAPSKGRYFLLHIRQSFTAWRLR